MAANTSPIFTLTPSALPAQISTANTDRLAATGSMTNILVAGSNGTRVEGFRAVAAQTTTAGVIRYWLTDGTGTSPKLFAERLVSAITPSTTVQVWSDTYLFDRPLIIGNGQVFKASTHNAEYFNIFPLAGDY